MGFLDKATGGFSGRLKRSGEETVRTVDYDLEPEQEQQEPRKPKPEKAPRKRLSELLPKPGTKKPSEQELEPSDDEPQDSEELELAYKIATDTAFEIDEDQPFYQEEAPKPNSTQKKKKAAEELVYDEEKIKDVLEILRIPATFMIPSDVLMPEDFKRVEFDLQIPQGYDIGQVEFFVERAESSIREYIELLEKRNEHVALLATTVDRLQVDLENLKFDSQIAAGIGIMPTSDNDELEKDNLELKMQVKKLEDALRAKTTSPELTSKERELYENVRNEFSILKREYDALEQDNRELRLQLAHMEEQQDDPIWMGGSQVASGAEKPEPQKHDSLPPLSPELDEGLPPIELHASHEVEHEKPLDAPLPSFDMEPMKRQDSQNFDFLDEDDEDEIDKLMKGLQ